MLNSSKRLSDVFYESPIMELYNRSINYLSQMIDMIDYCIDLPITRWQYDWTKVNHDSNTVDTDRVQSQLDFSHVWNFLEPSTVNDELKNIATKNCQGLQCGFSKNYQDLSRIWHCRLP